MILLVYQGIVFPPPSHILHVFHETLYWYEGPEKSASAQAVRPAVEASRQLLSVTASSRGQGRAEARKEEEVDSKSRAAAVAAARAGGR